MPKKTEGPKTKEEQEKTDDQAALKELEAEVQSYEPPEVDQETGEVVEIPEHRHNESESVVFTNVIHPQGYEFGVTIREHAEIEKVLARTDLIALEMANRGYIPLPLRGGYSPKNIAPPPQNVTQNQPQSAPNADPLPPTPPAQVPQTYAQPLRPQENISGNRPPLANPAKVVKLTNGVDGSGNVTINFWTDQPTWTNHRIFHLGAERLVKMLVASYPTKIDYDVWLAKLMNMTANTMDKNKGFALKDPWLVWWEVSPKDAKWKDTKAIKIPPYGEPNSEYIFNLSVGQPNPIPQPPTEEDVSLPV